MDEKYRKKNSATKVTIEESRAEGNIEIIDSEKKARPAGAADLGASRLTNYQRITVNKSKQQSDGSGESNARDQARHGAIYSPLQEERRRPVSRSCFKIVSIADYSGTFRVVYNSKVQNGQQRFHSVINTSFY